MATTEEIRAYNQKLAGHKANVQKLQTQIELVENDVNQRLKALSSTLGIEVTADNVEALYNQYKNELDNQLKNGMAILDRIEGNSVGNNGANNGVPQMQGQMQGANGYATYESPRYSEHGYNPMQPVGAQGIPQYNPSQRPLNMAPPVGSNNMQPGFNGGQQGFNFSQNPNPETVVQDVRGNFDTQQGFDMNTFGTNGGVLGV